MKTDSRFKIEYRCHGRSNWSSTFWIDQQGFTIATGRTKKEARWFVARLKSAFSKLEFKKGI